MKNGSGTHWDAIERDRFVPVPESNIASVLLARADHPQLSDKLHLLVSPKRGVVTQSLSFAALTRACLQLANALRREGVSQGARVVLSFGSDWAFIRTFYACQLLGAIPVPVIPPMNRGQVRARIDQLRVLAVQTEARVLVTDRRLRTIMEGGLGATGTLAVIAYEDLADETDEAAPVLSAPSDVSFIQYTSGSTGGRKGVPVTHGHLVTNINGIGRSLEIVPRDVGVSFLPVYHDMGLIGKVILTACHGNRLCQIPPLSFLRDPAHWLHAIDEHSGTVCAAPPFAYGMCARRIDPADIPEVDLSSWRIAMAAADMIQPHVLDAFASKFAANGFAKQAFLPVYGLAEATLAATVPVLRKPLVTLAVPGSNDTTRELVCVGVPLAEHELRIVSDQGKEVAHGVEGEIELRGPSIIDRYWGDREPRTRAGWLRTGDLGIQTADGLFISGRIKDIVKIHGRSVQPSEIEWAGEIDGVRRGCSAAFNTSAANEVVLVVESRQRDAGRRAALAGAVRARVREKVGIDIAHVAVVPPHTVPKTSSGKVRRSLTRERFEANALEHSRRGRLLDLAVAAVHVVRGAVSRNVRMISARVRASGRRVGGWS